MKKLLILGAGGFGRTIFDVAQQIGGYEKIAFLDDQKIGSNILGKCSEYMMFADERTEVYPAFGNNEIRMHWLEQLEEDGIAIPTLVHPRAYVSPTVTIGVGSVIMPMAAVNTNVTIGEGCIVNIGALLEHDSVMEDGSHLAPGAIVKGENRVPALMKVEAGQLILNRIYPL